jgi:formylmethanofuran dehydrogenase subunit D
MTTNWMAYADLANVIEMDGEALSVLKANEGWTIVRKTTNGQFAVMAIKGALARIIKVLPTLDRARAYNFAINR